MILERADIGGRFGSNDPQSKAASRYACRRTPKQSA